MSTQSTSTSVRGSQYEQSGKLSNGATRPVPGEDIPLGEALFCQIKQYSKEKPEMVALWAFGVGFVLGWKLKPW